MRQDERHKLIRQRIALEGSVSVDALRSLCGASAMTIWRDLAMLERSGAIRRIHGGAVANAAAAEPFFASKAKVASKAKHRLARRAIEEFVAPHDNIALEGGTTVAAIAEMLNKPVTVLTNSLEIVRRTPPAMQVICSGGIWRPVSQTFVGDQAEAFFANHFPTTAFVSAASYDEAPGLTDPNPQEVAVKRAMCRTAARVVLLLDRSKFGQRSLVQFLPLDEFDIVITDMDAGDSRLDAFARAKVDVRLVDLADEAG